MAAAGNYKNYNYQILTISQVDAIDSACPIPAGNGCVLSQIIDSAYAVATNVIADGSVTPAKQSTAARTRQLFIPVPYIAQHNGFDQDHLLYYLFTAPQNGRMVSARIVSDVGSTSPDINNQVLINLKNTTTGNFLCSADLSTFQTELPASLPIGLPINQNQDFSAGDVFKLDWSYKDNGNLADNYNDFGVVRVEMTYTI